MEQIDFQRMDFHNTLVRIGFLTLLDKEFGIRLGDMELEKMELARQCIQIFDSLEDFYSATQWEKDNPEIADVSYLEANQIIRRVDGKVWYFSRMQWESQK